MVIVLVSVCHQVQMLVLINQLRHLFPKDQLFEDNVVEHARNYRPVSFTLVCCKVLEKLVRNALLDHMLNNSILSDYQYGFGHGRSYTTQLLTVIDM